MNQFNEEDLDLGLDSLIGDLVGEILGFLSFLAIIYWLGDKLSKLWDKVTGRWD